ncbi:isoprenoid biosynthesis glyoxalase ElbB [Puniceicoccus vermicola]|uniref:Isoprenoid biosynthesis glyoxalase ElbB n=1 Tax=Puniceicoccus vermicola TaxID=388746 RepID=A0A7X1E4N1_9BACT|nr:isoprenoid biosynthesis glyoxalase ElbB [Puniceicoccus vermicola]MBC2602178.1 isoprenoid biosynthesis glyoxalase ElbB [Puniceicoccus vermicola]
MKKVAVLLSGSGVYDGSEIYEATFTLLALEEAGVDVTCCAPDIPQMHVINHVTGDVAEGESRSVLVEAARLARGEVTDLAKLSEAEFDALILPGGFGAAKNLCDFAVKGPDCQVEPQVAGVVEAFHAAGKPIGLMCIAPAIGAALFGGKGIRLTIGNDADTASGLQALGAEHVDCPVDEIVVDENNKVVTTPAYMLGPKMADVKAGIDKLVAKVLEMA